MSIYQKDLEKQDFQSQINNQNVVINLKKITKDFLEKKGFVSKEFKNGKISFSKDGNKVLSLENSSAEEFSNNEFVFNFVKEIDFDLFFYDLIKEYKKYNQNFSFKSSFKKDFNNMPRFSNGNHKLLNSYVKELNKIFSSKGINSLEDLFCSNQKISSHKHKDLGIISFRENNHEILRLNAKEGIDFEKHFSKFRKNKIFLQFLELSATKFNKNFFCKFNENKIELFRGGSKEVSVAFYSNILGNKTISFKSFRECDLFGEEIFIEKDFINLDECYKFIKNNDLFNDEINNIILDISLLEKFFDTEPESEEELEKEAIMNFFNN